jgi:hypothetical protein
MVDTSLSTLHTGAALVDVLRVAFRTDAFRFRLRRRADSFSPRCGCLESVPDVGY